MKKFLVGLLAILFFIPTCESVWAFSTDHGLLWDIEHSVMTEASSETTTNRAYQNYLSQSNLIGIFCGTPHGPHSPVNDCCYSNPDELNISLPTRGDEVRNSFPKPFPIAILVAFRQGAWDIHKASHGQVDTTNHISEKGYASLVGIVKRLD